MQEAVNSPVAASVSNPEVPKTKRSPAAKAGVLLLLLGSAAGAVYANRSLLFSDRHAAPTASNPKVPAPSGEVSGGESSARPDVSAPGTTRPKAVATTGSPTNIAPASPAVTGSGAVKKTGSDPDAPLSPSSEKPLPAPATATGSPAGSAAAPVPAPGAPPAPRTPLGHARLALESFLAAPDWQKRLEFAVNPDSIRESMAAHFRDHPDGPIPVEGISLMSNETVPGTTRALFGFRVRIKDFHSDIPMAVEETDHGFRVDWPPFLETYEQRLRTFFEKPGGEPGNFRVVLRRKHYFGPAVPGQDTVRQAFSVESPMRDESWVVWADFKSPVYTGKLVPNGATGWDTESFMIVRLEWRGDEKQGRWAALTDVVADNWQAR
jgi:hypothetical protein